MKQLLLSKEQYNFMINSIQECLSTDNYRPILKAINIKVANNHLTAVAIDGIRLAKTEFEITRNNTEDMEFNFTPIKIDKNSTDIVIEIDNDITRIKQITPNGVLTQEQPTILGDYINYNTILNGNDYSKDYTSIFVDAQVLSEMLKALKDKTTKNKVEIMINTESNMKPLFIKYNNEELKGETIKMLLPLRP